MSLEKILQSEFSQKNIDKAFNGQIAVDLVKKKLLSAHKYYDVVFLDLEMPIMNGLETIRQIYDLQPDSPAFLKKHTSIIICSANETRSDKEQALELGAALFLTKPIQIQQIHSIFQLIQSTISETR